MSGGLRVLVDVARVLPGWARACAAPLALLLAIVVAGLPGAWAAGDAPVAPALPVSQTITRAEFCMMPGLADTMPGASCNWQTVDLAKVWHAPRKDVPLVDAWFKLRFHLDAVPVQGLALYTVAFNRSGRVYVNGSLLRELGAMRDPLPLNWNRAQYIVLPGMMLRAGDNEIEIQQRIHPTEGGWLAPVRLGTEDELRPIWQRRVFWQSDIVRLLGSCTFAIGLFMLGVWFGRRRDWMYFWFGCMALSWSVQSVDSYAEMPPLPPLLWDRVVVCMPVLRGVFMLMFVLSYGSLRRPVVATVAWGYFLLGALAIFSGSMPHAGMDLWFLGFLVASIYILYLQVRVGLKRSRVEGVLLLCAGMQDMALSAHDLVLYSEHTWADRFYLAYYSAPLYLFVIGTILVRRFTESLSAHENLAAVLEQRVDQKAAELERNYEQLVEARRNEALALERTRIMSEMHDGIGSQLTMALSLVRQLDREHDPERAGEDGRVATVLRESIEDLQLIIDSLEPVENDLLTVLGTLRYRLQDRLGKSGIDLHWNVVDLPPLPMLTPHSVLSILRIVQEAFANCLKHSGADRIAVTTGLQGSPGVDEMAHIVIADNGRGIDLSRGSGRGLENMRRRAAALGGQMKIQSQAGGTEVRLEFPTLRSA
ncbi:MAG TPA: sensor histidine kinase [Burkholderiaceae bacterium]